MINVYEIAKKWTVKIMINIKYIGIMIFFKRKMIIYKILFWLLYRFTLLQTVNESYIIVDDNQLLNNLSWIFLVDKIKSSFLYFYHEEYVGVILLI